MGGVATMGLDRVVAPARLKPAGPIDGGPRALRQSARRIPAMQGPVQGQLYRPKSLMVIRFLGLGARIQPATPLAMAPHDSTPSTTCAWQPPARRTGRPPQEPATAGGRTRRPSQRLHDRNCPL